MASCQKRLRYLFCSQFLKIMAPNWSKGKVLKKCWLLIGSYFHHYFFIFPHISFIFPSYFLIFPSNFFIFLSYFFTFSIYFIFLHNFFMFLHISFISQLSSHSSSEANRNKVLPTASGGNCLKEYLFFYFSSPNQSSNRFSEKLTRLGL